MSEYKIVRMNIGGEWEYTVNRVEGRDLIPTRPIRYYKTVAGAKKRIKQLKKGI